MVDLMEETSYGRNIIAAVIEQSSENQRQGMISTQGHLRTAGGDCKWWRMPADRVDGKVGRRLSLLHISDDGVACDLWQVVSLIWWLGLKRNNFHFPVEEEEEGKRAGKTQVDRAQMLIRRRLTAFHSLASRLWQGSGLG
jgi:hypothetical protein